MCFLIGTVVPLVVFRLSKKDVCCLNVAKKGQTQPNFTHTGLLFKQEDLLHL